MSTLGSALRFVWLMVMVVVFVFEASAPTIVRAIDCPKEWNSPDCNGIKSGGGTSWIPQSGSSCGAGTGDLSGADVPTLVWNYFYSKLQNDNLTAAVWGNIKQESQFIPNLIEGMTRSNDPHDSGELAWGLVQWDNPSTKVLISQKNAGVVGPIYEASTQVQIIWWEMENITPTSYPKFNEKFKTLSGDLSAAVEFFQVKYESGAPGQRQQYAREGLQQYGGKGSAGSVGCGNINPECNNAQGNAKILCAAKIYDPVSYEMSVRGGHQGGAEWHKTCPTINASCYLDCSGLVNIAIYDLTKIDLRQNTFSQVADAVHWQKIPLTDLQPGDLIQPNTGHVEIVDHIEGDRVITFGAHSANKPQPDQVGPSSWPISGVGLRWKGAL